MKILVISDSHGRMDNVRTVLSKVDKLDQIIHLGDIIGQDDILRDMCNCPVTIVRGNGDFSGDKKIAEIVEVGKYKIFATHGHMYGVDWGTDRLYYAAEENKCNIAMYGHTHVPELTSNGGVTILNPGSISLPRQTNRKPSYIIMEIDDSGEAKYSINYL